MLRKIDISSANCIPSNVNFFETPGTSVIFERAGYKELLPLNPVSDPPFHFKNSSGASYVDYEKMLCLTEMRLKRRPNANADWVNVTAAENAAVIQAPGNSYIRNVKVNVGGQQIYNSNGLYSYKGYFCTELNSSVAAKTSHLAVQGYYHHGDSVDQNSIVSDSFASRQALFTDGKVVQFITKLNVDFFEQDLLALNNTEVEIEIHPQSSEFLVLAPGLQANEEYMIEYVHCKLYVKWLNLHAGPALEIERNLEKTPARYGIRKTEMKSFYFEPGRTEVHYNLFSDQVPRKIICAMVRKADYNGDYRTSPFNFGHFNVRDIRIEWNGQQNPSVPYELDFANGRYARAYHDLYEALGYAFTNDSCGITYKEYANGWAFFAFNLTNNLENDNCFDLLKEGTTSVHIKFAQEIPAGGVTMIVYAEFDSLMIIDKNRTVKTDMTV